MRVLPVCIALWTLMLTVPARAAEEEAWWVGLPVASVGLVGPEGGLPEESLHKLLQSQQGEPLQAGLVRVDLATLFQVGRFAAVEAEVEPWLVVDDEGNASDGVILSYVVYPAPEVARVRVAGNRSFRDRQILDAAGVNTGEVFYEPLDGPITADRVEGWLYRQGFTQAVVTLGVVESTPGQLEVAINIHEGDPNLLEHLSFGGDIAHVLPQRDHRAFVRWARRAGVVQGEPFAPEAISAAQQELRSQLASTRRAPFRRRRGWISARVTPAVVRTPSGTARVTYTIEPGPQLDLDVAGVGLWPRRKAQQALAIDERLRLTRGFLDEAPDRVSTFLAERGYYEATSTVEVLRPDPRTMTLRVRSKRGARHRMPNGSFPDFVGVDFEGVEERSSRAALQAVLDQSSVGVIRRDFFTESELEVGLLAARQWYVARGYQEAELELAEVTTDDHGFRPLRLLLDPLGTALFRRPPPREIVPTVRVVEGPLTLLEGLELHGAAEGVPLDFVAVARAERVGAPYSPQELERLSRRIVEAHRAEGYLEADARVVTRDGSDGAVAATLAVDPGPQVLLRSVVTRGPRNTRPAFIRREVDLTLGQPLTGPDLERVRRDLYDLGIFRTVDTELLGDSDLRDLVVVVRERPRWAFELGGGVSTDQGIRTFARATRRNLWGRAHRLDLLGQIGLDWRSDDVRDWRPNLVDPDWRAAISYTAPRFPTRRQDAILDLLLRERREERTWRMARTGGGAALETRAGARTTVRTGVRLETRQLQEVDLGALLESEPWSEIIGGLDDPVLPSPRWRVQEAVTGLIVHDLRNDKVAPSSGVLLRTRAEWAPGLPWDEWRGQPTTAFLKSDSRVTAYIPAVGFVLRLSGEGGISRALTEAAIPLEDRYRLGGTGSLRGFRREAVGPRNIAPPLSVDWPDGIAPLLGYALRDQPDRWVPTGGDATGSGTAELLMPLPALGLPSWEGYALAVFADVGNVWLLDDRATADTERAAFRDLIPPIRTAVGTGIRIATPVGPLQFDVASNLQALTSTGERRTFLTVDLEEPALRAHLTLGATF